MSNVLCLMSKVSCPLCNISVINPRLHLFTLLVLFFVMYSGIRFFFLYCCHKVDYLELYEKEYHYCHFNLC